MMEVTFISALTLWDSIELENDFVVMKELRYSGVFKLKVSLPHMRCHFEFDFNIVSSHEFFNIIREYHFFD